MAAVEISQKSLERVTLLCRNTILNKIWAGASYGAAAYIYRPMTVGDMELCSSQCLLLSLINSLVTEEVMSCCMLADICHQVQQLQSDHLRVWLVDDFVFPREDMEKAMAFLSKLLAIGILKLPSNVIKIMSSLATKYGIHCDHLVSPSVKIYDDSAIQLENPVTGGGGVNRLNQSEEWFVHSTPRNSSNAGMEAMRPSITNPLEEAVKNDSASSIKTLLTAGAEVNRRFFRGDTYLHIAAEEGHNRALEALLEGGMNKDEQNYLGETPLVRAVRAVNALGVEMLLENGADDRILPREGKSLLEMIIESQNTYMFKALMKVSTDMNFQNGETIFHLVARSGNAEMIKVIKDQRLNGTIKNQNGHTALHVASDPSVVRVLIEMGVDVNERTSNGETALHLATSQGSLTLVSALVQQGADVNAQDREGTTALILALNNSKEDIVTFLLHNGANPNIKDEDGRAPLHYAAEAGFIVSVTILLDAGARVNDKDNKKESPVLLASENNKPTVVKHLAKCGADLTIKDRCGFSLLNNAASSGYNNVVAALLEGGMSVDMKNELDMTALMEAANEGHISTVKVLLDHGADPVLRNEEGWTPLMYASSFGLLDVVQLFIGRGVGLNDRTIKGETALYWANKCNHKLVADYLISKGGIV